MIVHGAFSALPTISTRTTKWRLATAPDVILKPTRLALALIALTKPRLIAIAGISAAHAECPEVLYRAERRELSTTLMVLRITRRTLTFNTERSKGILAIIMCQATHAHRIAIPIAFAKWSAIGTA